MAGELGFVDCGFTTAIGFPEDEEHLRQWLSEGKHAEMGYMERNIHLRANPSALFPGCRTMISFVLAYYSEKAEPEPFLKMSKYALGRDYHLVMREKLEMIQSLLTEILPEAEHRICVDSAPVFERAVAVRAGLGWIGKNTCFIHPVAGSFVFLGEILTSAEISPDSPYSGPGCGNCSLCLTACPTNSLVAERCLDARKCISYITVEHKGDIPDTFYQKTDRSVFGCDRCQDCCPKNSGLKTGLPEFSDAKGWNRMKREDWLCLKESVGNSGIRGTAMERTGIKGLMRNVHFALKSQA